MKKFPKDFLWGVSTAAFQIEGACNADGRGESIWDRYCQTPGNILDGSNGDQGCDHYYHYKEDISLMKKLNVQVYRFSISWSRIFPDGYGKVNKAGADFYKKLVQCLKENDIQPVVTLYHWDLPQKLQDIGGWTNPEVVNYFVDYAEYVFQLLGNDVAMWITFNEPYCTSFVANWYGVHAPGNHDYKTALLVAHHLLLAHGRTIKAYCETGLKGKIGISISMDYHYPESERYADLEAVDRLTKAKNMWFSDPVLKGQYPEEIVELYKKKNLMPEITEEQMKEIYQPIDFLGINNYSGVKVCADESSYPLGLKERDFGEEYTESGWGINPQAMHDLLIQLHQNYGDIPIYITENGAAFQDTINTDGKVEDKKRIEFLHKYLNAVHQAIEEGAPVEGYFLWSFLDNFEWSSGYTIRFGIVYVDYDTKERIVKESGNWYRNVIKSNGIE